MAGLRTTADVDAWNELLPSECTWAAVADGMGGHAAGEHASRIAIAAIADGIAHVTSERAFVDLVRFANRRIFQAMHAEAGRNRMGCTIVSVTLREGTAIVVNVGDSRAYKWSNGRLDLLSRDHTIETTSSTRRIHALTQSLGGVPYEIPISPHAMRLSFGPSDALLLCSDGLTDMVDHASMVRTLHAEPNQPASALVEAALSAGGRDNVTAVVIGPEQQTFV